MKKIVRLTENDLSRIVKRVIMEMAPKGDPIEFFTDSGLKKSIGKYTMKSIDHTAGSKYIYLSKTNSSQNDISPIQYDSYDGSIKSKNNIKLYTTSKGHDLIDAE